MDDIFSLDDADIASSKPVQSNSARLMPTFNWLDPLNPEQRQAVETTQGPLLVLSGAGTGKTKVLTTRLAYILANRLAQPWECLVVTFTNRAAGEMKERVFNMIGDAASSVWLGTFHSICVKILRSYAPLVGLQANFTILGEDDQKRLVKKICAELGLDDKKYQPSAIVERISLWKDKGKTASRVALEYKDSPLASIYRIYQQRLRELNCVDFGDIILYTLEILQKNADVLDKYQNRFKYIMVDEYQDTNVTQYLLIRLLCQKHRNICCVGDDDQSIYSWRGAEIENILRFNQDFSDAQTIRLERNYRSTAHILAAASALIRHNEGRLGKELHVAENSPALKAQNAKIKVVSTYSGDDEAALIAGEIDNARRDGYDYSQMAVLVRTAAQTRILEEKFISEAIPYQVIGGQKFYERAEIRDIVAYIRVVLQPSDDLALERIINKPARGIGAKTIEKFQDYARSHSLSLYQAIEAMLQDGSLNGKVKNSATELLAHFTEWRRQAKDCFPDEVATSIIQDSGYLESLKIDASAEAPARIDNLKELINTLSDHEQYPHLEAFMEHVSLVMDNDDDRAENKVRIITLHSAKGLEFEVVFLPGWEEGLFPHQRALDEGAAALEEERRLAYVAITRAKHRLFITMAFNRKLYGEWKNNQPSRFIDELPAEHLEIINSCSYFGSNQSNFEPYSRKNGANYSGNRSYSSAKYCDNRSAKNAWRNKGYSEPYEQTISDGSGRYSYVRPAYNQAAKNWLGKRVVHQSFGNGTVVAQDGNVVQVCFDQGGIKKIVCSYLRPAG